MSFKIEGLDDFGDNLRKAMEQTVEEGGEKLRREFQAAVDSVYASHHGKPPSEVEAALLGEFRRRDLGDQPQALQAYAKPFRMVAASR